MNWSHRKTAFYLAGSRWWIGLLILVLVGCGQGIDHRQRYVEGRQQYVSQNGLGVHRKLWEQAGARCFAPKRLSNRLSKIDVIVLAANTFRPPGQQARQWLEKWLSQAPGRTVIYFGRDFDASSFYFQQTVDQLPPAQQRLAKQRIAELRLIEWQERLNAYEESTFCEWFYLKTETEPIMVHRVDGPWAKLLPTLPDMESDKDEEETPFLWPVQTRLLPPDKQFKDAPPSSVTTPPAANPLKPIQSPLGQGEDKLIVQSEWTPAEFDSTEKWNAAFDQVLKSRVLLTSEEGDPLVFQLTHPQRLGQGRILIVANGAPVLNASLVHPFYSGLGQLLVKECLPAKRVALLSFNDSGIQIFEGDESDLRGAGLEMLLYWPLSAITMSAALLGILACAYLFPILGRPQDLPRETVSDFGLHVEAVGEMLHETGDTDYAHRVVGEYFRTVRGEHPPAWIKETSPNQS